jgi:hypothetical protein
MNKIIIENETGEVFECGTLILPKEHYTVFAENFNGDTTIIIREKTSEDELRQEWEKETLLNSITFKEWKLRNNH